MMTAPRNKSEPCCNERGRRGERREVEDGWRVRKEKEKKKAKKVQTGVAGSLERPNLRNPFVYKNEMQNNFNVNNLKRGKRKKYILSITHLHVSHFVKKEKI